MGLGTLALLAIGGGAAVAAQSLFGGDGVDIPDRDAQNVTKTAKREDDLSDTARRKRRRQASFLTRDPAEPQLGTPSLKGLGLGQRDI